MEMKMVFSHNCEFPDCLRNGSESRVMDCNGKTRKRARNHRAHKRTNMKE